MQGHFNKLAWIRRLLMESRPEDVEWVMWIDMDTVCVDCVQSPSVLPEDTRMRTRKLSRRVLMGPLVLKQDASDDLG